MSKLKLTAFLTSAICFGGIALTDSIVETQMTCAQDPFSSDSGDDPFGGSGDDVFGGGNAATTSNRPSTETDLLSTDPLAIAFLNNNYPDEKKRVFAAITMFNTGEPKVGAKILEGLGAPLSDQAALDFVRTIGSPQIIGLTLREDFPVARKSWFQDTMSNAMTYATSEANVNESLDQLIGNDTESYDSASRQLQVAGMNAGGAILQRIQQLLDSGDLQNPALRRLVQVVQAGPKTWDLALRSLVTHESEVRPAAILALAARSGDGNNAAAILIEQANGPVHPTLAPVIQNWNRQFETNYGFSPSNSTQLKFWIEKQIGIQQNYIKELSNYRSALNLWENEEWLWQPEVANFVPVTPDRYEVPARNQSLWATALLKNSPTDPTSVNTYIVSQLQLAKVISGVDSPLPPKSIELVSAYSNAENLNQLLKSTLKQDLPIAAQAIMEAMGEIGDSSQLQMHRNTHAPIVQALNSHDVRVRFAAAQTILKWKPTTRFSGSSYFNNVMGEMLGSTVGAQVIVLSSNESEANFLNAMARNDGWESEIARSTSQMFQMLEEQPISMLVLTDAMGDEPFVSVIDRIRELPKGAHMPIALLLHGDNLKTAGEMFRSDRVDRNIIIASIDGPVQATSEFISEASQLADQLDLPQNLKLRKTYDALRILNQWCSDEACRRNVDYSRLGPVVIQLLNVTQLSTLAAEFLANHGNPSTQHQLAILAGNVSQSPDARAAAANAFRTSVQKFGLLLTTSEIAELYDRQNRSRNENQFSQEILNSILDTIEARHKRVAFDKLPAIPVSK